MDLETIKSRYSMQDILDRCNIPGNKNGFCKCVFHKEDTASMKVYKTGYYCFGCGKGGDIISFVKSYQKLDFKDASQWISGEELSRRLKDQVTAANIRRKKKQDRIAHLKQELREVNQGFDGLWQRYINAEPLSTERADALNRWQLLVYKQETILNELGAT